MPRMTTLLTLLRLSKYAEYTYLQLHTTVLILCEHALMFSTEVYFIDLFILFYQFIYLFYLFIYQFFIYFYSFGGREEYFSFK